MYMKLRAEIVRTLDNAGFNYKELVDKKVNELRHNDKYKGIGTDELYRLADTEALADCCETMLQNSKLLEKLAAEDYNLAEKLINAIKKAIESLRNFFKDNPLEAKTEYGQALLEAMNKVENRVQELWDKAVAEGIRADKADVVESKSTKFDDKNKKITLGMSESERYEILKGRTLDNVPIIDDKSLKRVSINSWNDINSVLGNQKRNLLHKLASEFGVFKDYDNSDIDLEFTFSHNNFRESYGKQKKGFDTFGKMFSVFDDVVANAVGVEVHNRNKEGYKTDPTLNAVYVLISAFRDGKFVVPVKLEIKEFKDKTNGLYVAIALEKVKATEVSKQGNTENGVTQNSRSVANISIAQLFKKINPNDTQFIKYIPDKFLNNKQLEAKKQALQEETDTEYVDNSGQKYDNLKFQDRTDPDYFDELFDMGEDLFEDESKRQMLNELIDKYPDDALSIIKHAAEQTIENVLTKTKSIKLSDKAYLSIAQKFMQDYNISRAANPGEDAYLVSQLKNIVARVETGEDVVNEIIEVARDALMLGGTLDDSVKEERDFVLGLLKGKTLIVTDYNEPDIRENYGDLKRYRSKLGHGYIALERNAKKKLDGVCDWHCGQKHV